MAAKESKVCDKIRQVLKKQFECYVCGIGPRPEKMSWYKCLDGHAICQDCKNDLRCELLVEPIENDPLGIGSRITRPCLVKVEDKYENDEEEYCYESILEEPCKMIAALLSMKTMRFECINEDKGCKKLLVFWTKKL